MKWFMDKGQTVLYESLNVAWDLLHNDVKSNFIQ